MKDIIRIIGIPVDLGQFHRGVNMGPSAMRYAELAVRLRRLGYAVKDAGDVLVPVRETLIERGDEDVLPAIYAAEVLIYEAARKAVDEGVLPIFLGGDHSVSIGTIGGVTHNLPCGVIWIDAHGDCNTPESSLSGNIHGMPLATLLGKGHEELVNLGRPGAKLSPEDVVMVGIRDLDPDEKEIIRAFGVKVYTMRDIDERGMSVVIREAMDYLSHHDRLHVSIDADGIDPMVAPGVGTPVPGGITYREAHLAMEIISDSKRLSSIDMVEINPMLDNCNATARMAVDLLVSLCGKSII